MAQEFFINSQELEDKIRTLLPSQGGLGAGFDLSASTQIIPIIDLTESAEGSNVRQDIQTAISHGSATTFNVDNTTTTILTTTGYFRLIGCFGLFNGGARQKCHIILSDGSTDKIVFGLELEPSSSQTATSTPFDFVIFLPAGASCKIFASVDGLVTGSARQIADITGTLVNPT